MNIRERRSMNHQQLRWKSNTNHSKKKPSLSKSIQSLKNKSASAGSPNQALFGLRPVDFTIVPPLYRQPPPPPPKTSQRLIFPLTVVMFAGITGYFYFNNKNDSYEYWEAMQTGGVLPGTYDDDDDDDFDDDDFDEDDDE